MTLRAGPVALGKSEGQEQEKMQLDPQWCLGQWALSHLKALK